ncbi:PRC-barrel domain-containing protein [Rhizobium sp. Root482]|uniref:PRC-barrel domain-containing protein n=1 Tax=Rhizobium sp. Root482 TaxID=1736543 RepID=UPI0006F9229F|nr:PRC-barrel domain-containing protein [Rhizobium sp. Root482]KQY20033.1 hypothetical protein ASD31_06570 [Rhizobium sp. Root482]
MTRTLLATTAIALCFATGALAQEATSTTSPAAAAASQSESNGAVGYFSAAPEQVLASSVLGKTVYTGADEKGEAIGDVNDVVINADGGTEALVVGVGGFLGLGEKDVAINFDRVSWSDRDGQRIIVVTATKEELQQAPEFQRAAIMDGAVAASPEEDAASATATDGQTAQTDSTPGTTPQMTDPEAAAPEVDNSTTAATPTELQPVDPALISAEKLVGTNVKVADDTKVGEIGDVILGKDGKVEAYVIDVGGFLGIGEKPVAMSAKGIQVMADAAGDMVIYSPFTKEQLENQPAYDEDAYKANPQGFLMTAPAN